MRQRDLPHDLLPRHRPEPRFEDAPFLAAIDLATRFEVDTPVATQSIEPQPKRIFSNF
jgi:hypothetical protein